MNKDSIRKRQSIRLRGFDYASGGIYFITISTHNMQHLFGSVRAFEAQLNALGEAVKARWLAIPEYYPNVILHAFVIMPNHLHGLVEIGKNADGEKKSSLGSIVRGVKTAVTQWSKEKPEIGVVWQRNYYEQIIRSMEHFWQVTDYIENNPRRWEERRKG